MPRFVILMPVFDDWTAAGLVISQLDAELAAASLGADVLLVDDGSPNPAPPGFPSRERKAIRRVQILRLRRNLGHQRALAVGLCAAASRLPGTDVIVMDADGEDRPSDVPRLVAAFEACGGGKAVFARRLRRSEGLLFSAAYRLYRFVHLLLTGIPVQVGNFSVVPASMLPQLVVASELWNHYAAAVVKLGLPRELVDVSRGQRLDGRSKMGFVPLVAHGLGAMSVFADRIGVRLLVSAAVLSGLVLVALAGVFSLRWLVGLALPGWTGLAAGVLLILMAQMVTAALIFVLMIHQGRAGASIVPARDVEVFVESLTSAPVRPAASDVPGS